MEEVLNIVYLEDDRLDIELVRETLTREGIEHRLIPVDTKPEFVKALNNSSLNLILADYSLPSFDGIAAFEIAQNLSPDIPFIFVSGKIGEDLAVETIKRGATDYVLKQRLSYLAPAVRRALQAAKERQKRIAAEDALRESEKKFRSMVETTSDWVWEIDSDGIFTYAGPKVQNILGYDQEEVVGKVLFDFIADYEIKRCKALLKDRSKNPIPVRGWEVDHTHESGRKISIEISGIPVFDENEKLSGWRGFNRDITERKQAEKELRKAHDELEKRVEDRTAELVKAFEKLGQEVDIRQRTELALRESQEQYRDLVETINDVIWEIDTAGIYTYVSPRAGDILGHEPDELIDKSFFEHMPPEEAERIKDLFKTQESVPTPIDLIEIKKTLEDGQVKILESSGKPFFDTDGNLRGYRGAYRDVTERKRIEAEIKKSDAELRRLSSKLLNVHEKESKRIGAELHDGIAQTVSAIKMRAEVALLQYDKHDASEVRKSLESVINIAQEAVEEIRRISRDLRPSMLDNLGILPTVSWLCREFENSYPQIHIEELIDIQEEDVSDPLKTAIFRILQESLNNVTKHSDASYVILTLRTYDGKIDVTVNDNGTGFDTEKILNEEHPEKGLGLASMRERAEFSNGTFSVESCEGEGTTLRASWPIS